MFYTSNMIIPELLFIVIACFFYFKCKNRVFKLDTSRKIFVLNNFEFSTEALQIINKYKNSINLVVIISFVMLSLGRCLSYLTMKFSIPIDSIDLAAWYDSGKIYLFDIEFAAGDFELFFKYLLVALFGLLLFSFYHSDKFLQFKNYLLDNNKFQTVNLIFSCEFLLLLCFFCIAGCAFISSENLFFVFLSKETQTLILCFLIVYSNTKLVAKSGLYFFFQAALYSFFFLFGMLLIYYDVATLNFRGILDYIVFFKAADLSIFWLKIGFLFILISFGFKLGVPPFNLWVLNLFSIAPRIVIYVVSILSKVIVFSIFFKLNGILYYLFEFELNFFVLTGVFSLLYASLAGLVEYDLFRIFAYSSFNHLGIMLLALSFNNLLSYISVFIYLIVYLLNSLFFLLISLYKNNLRNVLYFSYHFYVDPFFCVIFCIILFSMIGIPPFLGFFAKMMVGVVLFDNYLLLIVFLVTSIFTLMLYLRIVRIIFFGGYNHSKFYYYSFPPTKTAKSGVGALYLFFAVSILVLAIYLKLPYMLGSVIAYISNV
jgi:NADH-quinone oxidoreductase subunit N